ncbi:MAG TPA: Rrf2 family transcriptional regulator [Ignavibacteria bacterium]|nr:Rrf2 family transcriptional regulator [Ignavibacteria bacterium]
MFKLSKKVEYGLIAMKHIAVEGEKNPCSAKEIASQYKIPYDLLSKILQKLKKHNLLSSVQGTHGGYVLSENPQDISLATIFNAIEGYEYILDCGTGDDPHFCKLYDTCILSAPLQKIQKQLNAYFNSTKLSEIV